MDLHSRILIADDEPAETALLSQALWRRGFENIKTTCEASKVVELCSSFEPDLLILDLHMSEPDGFEILASLRADRQALRILATTSDAGGEVQRRALEQGAHEFMLKPLSEAEAALRSEKLLKARRVELTESEQLRELEERLYERTNDFIEANMEAIALLAVAAEFRDEDVGEHIFRVGRSTSMLAEKMGLEPILVELFRTAATLHDVGKIAVPDSVLLKPGPLDDDEWMIMKSHAEQGYRILRDGSSQIIACAAKIAHCHHEHWDGGGYPNGLSGTDIFLSARLVAVADVFDALTSKRPYKKAWSIEDASAEIMKGSGTQFDPEVVAAFAELDKEVLTSSINESEFFALGGKTSRYGLEPIDDRLDL